MYTQPRLLTTSQCGQGHRLAWDHLGKRRKFKGSLTFLKPFDESVEEKYCHIYTFATPALPALTLRDSFSSNALVQPCRQVDTMYLRVGYKVLYCGEFVLSKTLDELATNENMFFLLLLSFLLEMLNSSIIV